MIRYFISVGFLVLLDQFSKFLAFTYISFNSIALSGFLSLTFAQNYGAAFSFLANSGGWQRYFLSFVSIFASIAIIIWLFKTPARYRLKRISLTLLLSGAIGNMIDRIFNGFVIDFIDFHYGGFYFPIFNLADIFISIGVVLLILSDFKK